MTALIAVPGERHVARPRGPRRRGNANARPPLSALLARPIPSGACTEPPARALLISLAESGRQAVLVVGFSPSRLLDDAYRGFIGLVAEQIGAAVDKCRGL